MTTLVVGASGATGRLLVEQLLKRGESVKIIVRTGSQLPEALKDHENEATGYDAHPSPITIAIFDSGITSRINVRHFMAELITDAYTWSKWRGQMPVIYNKIQV
jgi:uncharacterized protein YbjT (DUF2867 family)